MMNGHWAQLSSSLDSSDETGGNFDRPDSRASSGLDSAAEADNEIGEDAEENNEGNAIRPNETSATLDKLVRDWTATQYKKFAFIQTH